MNLIEFRYPKGALTATERAEIAASITSALMGNEAMAPEETLRRARQMTHFTFHEVETWITGEGPLAADAPPPFVVTATVPEAWREEMSRTWTGAVRAVITRYDAAHGYRRHGGDVWVNVVGVADGSIGLNAKASTADDVLLYMTEEFRTRHEEVINTPDGGLIDPICGMHVHTGPNAILLEHDGTTVGFCSRGCRSAWARQHGIEVPASA